MGDLTFTPMYTYVYNYRPPPAYTEVVQPTYGELVQVCMTHVDRKLS